MYLYIHPENQELLWKIINKHPLIEKMGQGSLHEKQNWFKHIIQLFYDKTGGEILDLQKLKQNNQDTILYMVENLKNSGSNNQMSTSNIGTLANGSLNYMERNVAEQTSLRPPPKTNVTEFGERQKEYNNMLAKPLPPEPNFSEKISDEAISKMYEIIAQHKKQREDELKQYAPSPISGREVVDVA